MKKNIGRKMTAGMVVCAMALAIQQAGANPIDTTTFNLSNPNSGISGDPSPYASVEIDLTSSTAANFIINGLTTGGDTYKLSDMGVNVNGSVTVSSVTGPSSYSTGSGNEDGFGAFNLIINTPNGSSAAVPQITFTLTLNTGSWGSSAANVLTANGQGNLAAIHIYAFDSKGNVINTGFAGNGTTTDVPDGGATALLLGVALTGIGSVRRKMS